jgi:PAS domain S-box-containing protein
MADETTGAGPVTRILVVDDTEASRYAVARHLRRAGYEVEEAGTATEAFAALEDTRLDLVVLDVLLPDISGFEVARRIRRDPRFFRLPILHLSASFTDPDSLAAGLDSGADGYLTHPVEPVVLLASIRSLLRARAAEAEAVTAGEAWRATFQAIGDAVCVVNARACVTRWNNAFETLVGHGSIVGRPLPELVPGLRVRSEAPYLIGPDGSPPQGTEVTLDGRWVRVTVQPMTEAVGLPKHAVCVLTDVTKQRSAEMRMQQVQRLEVAGQLAGGIAHEINNMMTVILGLTEFLARDADLPAVHQNDLAGVRKAADRAADMARQLLAFSRRQVLQPRMVDINTALAGMSRLLRQLMGADRQVTLTLSPMAGYVFADEAQLEQAVLNLALNARDAMPGGGHFTITTGQARLDSSFAARYPAIEVRPGEYAHIALADNGEGMSAETLERVFEPFFTTKPVGQGTGLGLATVYGIVKQSNGYIWPESAPGKGTTFNIYLPQAVAPSGDDPGLEPAPKPTQGSGTILVVDDEPMVRALARRALEAYGYTVLEAEDGREALRTMDTDDGRTVALVLADLVMPGMGGRELGTRLQNTHPGVPVLFMSAHTGDELARRRLLSPGIWFLQKPFAPDELVSQVQLRLHAAGRS